MDKWIIRKKLTKKLILDKQLGFGSYSRVYKVTNKKRDPELTIQYALKVINKKPYEEQ